MDYFLTRMFLQKGLAFIYCIAFLIALNQYPALVGENGIAPMGNLRKITTFFRSPGLFIFHRSDRFIRIVALAGTALSLFALSGMSERYGLLVSSGVWLSLWFLYLSFVNAGGIFYGYGWEIMLLESGFLAVFLGSSSIAPSVLVIGLYRWVLFRMMFGSGMIKVRSGGAWKDLTAMIVHYETQPLPGPFSRLLHNLPVFVHKFAVLFTYFIELPVPFFFFWPGIASAIAGCFTLFFQGLLLLSGNLSWLNCLTVVLAFSCFSDADLLSVFPGIRIDRADFDPLYFGITAALTALVAYLGIPVVRNLLSSRQVMNGSFDPFHLVNTYGAFGSVTRVRREIVIEGTNDPDRSDGSWLAYEFKAKPGDPKRSPPQVTPYHYKIDWQMWFAALSSHPRHPWFPGFMQRILEGNKEVLSLLRSNPFRDRPPLFLRAKLYEYRFAPIKKGDKKIWLRKEIGLYFPEVHLVQTDKKSK